MRKIFELKDSMFKPIIPQSWLCSLPDAPVIAPAVGAGGSFELDNWTDGRILAKIRIAARYILACLLLQVMPMRIAGSKTKI